MVDKQPDRNRVSLDITLRGATEFAKRTAKEISEAKTMVPTADGPMLLAPSEITEDDIRREAKRISSIESDDERETEIFNLIASSIPLIRDSQELAREYLLVAESVDAASARLKFVQEHMIVEELKDDEGQSQ